MSATIVTKVVVPENLDAADSADFQALGDVFNEAMEQDLGLDHLRWVPAEELPAWQDGSYTIRIGYLARRDGRAVGALQLFVPLEADAQEINFDILALPDSRGLDVEEALLDALIEEARAHGRSILQTYTLHRFDTPHEKIAPPTGFGEIPVDEHTVFFRDHGFELKQVERNSAFDLTGSFEQVAEMLDEALAFAGPDYRLVAWTGLTPEQFVDGMAFVRSRMSTDVPLADTVWTDEVWDAERVRTRDRTNITESGLTQSVTAVEHVPTARIVAFSELSLGHEPTDPSHQWGTLVVREHRGHRLGTIVKCANLLRWREIAPESPMVSTFNAEENRPMLAVNERVGFVPLTVAGVWKRVLE